MTQDMWEFWIDRGGTFTDVVAKTPDNRIITHKLLSENSKVYSDAAIQGIRDLMNLADHDPIPAHRIRSVKMGTTVATNALLERKGDPTLLIVTKGFRDALEIGYQARPNIFAREIVKPELLYQEVMEIDERVCCDGTVERAPDLEETERALREVFERGIRSAAIIFMHSYAFPEHESQVAEIARKIGFTQISASHQVSPLMKFVGRGDTTVVDAYLSPVLARYVQGVERVLLGHKLGSELQLMFMMSSGGLTRADLFQGKDAILSGPAGGVVGAVETSLKAGFNKIIGFDMGGTSTDVSHFDGTYERTFETAVAGVRVRAPMMMIHTVAAGGGSILHYDGFRFQVGPDSAGADPGPKCYRRGGPLSVTDANVMVGRLKAKYFPAIFGPEQDLSLDGQAVERAFSELAARIGEGRRPEDVANGFLSVAVENMANAIKKISVQRGYDVSGYALTCFGGAGGQHACAVADTLGMSTVFIHPHSGILSAYGMGLAQIRSNRSKSFIAELSEGIIPGVRKEITLLEKETSEEVRLQGVDDQETQIYHRLHLRYDGTDTSLPVTFGSVSKMIAAFEAAHKKQFGFIYGEKPVFVEAIEVEAAGGGTGIEERIMESVAHHIEPDDKTRIYYGGEWITTDVYLHRERFRPGLTIAGPALIIESHQTIVVDPGWQGEVTKRNDIILKRYIALEKKKPIGTDADPVMLEVFNNLYMSIAEQMGVTLQNTASSVNIKERVDFSCAVFAADGSLVANAPHMPVHLGSMDRSVETIIDQNKGKIRPGDVFALNAPYNGGTHLPDITVVTPVFGEGSNTITFYVASRGHHADVGGKAPGSMTPRATTVEEEGVLIDNFRLVDQGVFQEQALRELLTDHPYPVRNVDQNVADMKAQIAANEKGVHELRKMVEHYGLDVVQSYMAHVQDNAEESVRRVIEALHDSEYHYETDQGASLKVRISVDKKARQATVDFTGTSPQQNSNFNAPEPVTRAAVLYCFRLMVDEEIPMNAGCLRPIDVIVPEGCMLNPRYPAAVVAGNVETSQQVTNALLGALGAMANSQGTMNNLTFGNDRYQYYETICSGSPAGPGFHGTDAVQVHMTNSRLTDPEVLEFRYPVLLEDFHIRRDQKSTEKWSPGCGTERRIRFLEDMNCAILSSHRKIKPRGILGGAEGQCGRTYVERLDGTIDELEGCDQTELKADEVVVIQPPIAGGCGKDSQEEGSFD